MYMLGHSALAFYDISKCSLTIISQDSQPPQLLHFEYLRNALHILEDRHLKFCSAIESVVSYSI